MRNLPRARHWKNSMNNHVILENATALGSRIPLHAVLLQVNENTPVKLYSLFKNGVHLRNDVRTIGMQ